MRLTIIAVLASLIAIPAHADSAKNCAAAWLAKPPADKTKTTFMAFSAVCQQKSVSANAVPGPPTGATAVCGDGTYSMSKTVQGRCAGHKGIAASIGPQPASDDD